MTLVKICGLKSADMVRTSIDAGADFLGFVFVRTSPRFIHLKAVEPLLAQCKEAGVPSVGLWQESESLPLNDILASGIDILQAHGTCPGFVTLPTWYALGISKASDLPREPLPYDCLLFDAKPPKNAVMEGGHGVCFDWTILSGYQAHQPWVLAGGLKPDTVAEAIRISGAKTVDVSSGVEIVKGEKDADLIRDFIQAAKQTKTKP